jgi:hypothetical protein
MVVGGYHLVSEPAMQGHPDDRVLQALAAAGPGGGGT